MKRKGKTNQLSLNDCIVLVSYLVVLLTHDLFDRSVNFKTLGLIWTGNYRSIPRYINAHSTLTPQKTCQHMQGIPCHIRSSLIALPCRVPLEPQYEQFIALVATNNPGRMGRVC